MQLALALMQQTESGGFQKDSVDPSASGLKINGERLG